MEEEAKRVCAARERCWDPTRIAFDDEDLQDEQPAKVALLLDWLAESTDEGRELAIPAAVKYLTHGLRTTKLQRKSFRHLEHNLNIWLGIYGLPPASTIEEQRQQREDLCRVDFADLARQITYAGWEEGDDDQIKATSELCEDRPDHHECYHTCSMPILNLLRRCAWGQARGRVMLTVGTQLPPELTEEVFEYALVAEDLPLDKEYYVEGSALAEYGQYECPVLEQRYSRDGSPRIRRLWDDSSDDSALEDVDEPTDEDGLDEDEIDDDGIDGWTSGED